MADWWQKRPLGRTGITVSRIGLGSSYGIAGRDVDRAVERGINYLYWGSRRIGDFGTAITRAAKRDRSGLCVVVQSYSRSALALGPSLDLALKRLAIDYADILLLGWWNAPPPRRILDRAQACVEAGKARAVMISCHHRPTFAQFIADPQYGAIMVRYNAAHRGAESEVFPHLAQPRPGVVAYTATRWGTLLDPTLLGGERVPRGSDCYRFALSRPEVDVVLAGPKNGAELDEALVALDRGPLDADERAWLERCGNAVRTMTARDAVKRRNPAALWQRMVGAAQRLFD